MHLEAPPVAPTGDAPPLELLEMALDPATDHDAGSEESVETGRKRPLWRYGVGVTVALALAVWLLFGVRSGEPNDAETLSAAVSPGIDAAPTSPAGAVRNQTPPHGVDGFAELYVSAYLTATGPDRQGIIERYYPAARQMDERTSFDRYVTRAVVVDIAATGAESWNVLVAAEVLSFDGRAYVLDGMHYFAVPVLAPPNGPLVATALPARVAAPVPGEIPAVVVGVPVTDPGLQALATGFVRTYVTDIGSSSDELARYTTAGFAGTAISPAPFVRITVDDITGVQITSDRLHIRIAGVGTPERGDALPIEYHLDVVVEGGAWKVAGLAPGPLTAAQLAEAETVAKSES